MSRPDLQGAIITMCRLFGLRANRPVDVEFSLGHFRTLGIKHPTGWGIGSYQDGTPEVHKESQSAHDSAVFTEKSAEVESTIVLSHVRFASRGEPRRENCHPFAFGSWLFAHNGTVRDHGSLEELLQGKWRAASRGQTDSEVFFHWILQNVERERDDVVRGIRSALPAVREFTGLNFLLTDGSTLFAYREASTKPDHYTLFYLRRDPLDKEPERFESELGTLLRSKALRGEKAVLVCSEELTDEDWQCIEPGHLLIVSETLEPEVVRVR